MLIYTRPLYGALPTRPIRTDGPQGSWPRVVTARANTRGVCLTWTCIYDGGTHKEVYGIAGLLAHDPLLTLDFLRSYYTQSKGI